MPLDVMEGSDTVRHIFIFLLMVMLSPISWGSDFAKGLDTYEKEDYATALREMTPLAEQGDATSQYRIGLMYSADKILMISMGVRPTSQLIFWVVALLGLYSASRVASQLKAKQKEPNG